MQQKPRTGLKIARGAPAIAALLVLGGCATFMPEAPPPPPPPPVVAPAPPPVVAPVAMHQFPFDPKTTRVLGEVQVTQSRHEDTLADIARRFDVGYDELIRANPGVDPWLPGDGTRIVLPTQWVLPDGPREGIVVNVAAMRLFYFPKPQKKGDPRIVITYPIGVGKVGWATPIGETTVVSKRKNPMWTPPESVRREHAKKGDPLPARVPPGPDNPLGAYAMNLGWTSYLIHGTNKPPGVGMRASHGCIRLYPEDIAAIFPSVAVGTRVTVVNQPLLYAWQGNTLFVQSYPPVVEGKDDSAEPPPVVFDDELRNRMWQETRVHESAVNWGLVERVVTQTRGIAVPVTKRGLTLDTYLASARRVENVLPEGSNWDGNDAPPPKDGVKPLADSGARARR